MESLEASLHRLADQRARRRPPTKREVAVERSTVLVTALQEILRRSPTGSWIGSSTDLCALFDRFFTADPNLKPRLWPSTPSGMALLLRSSYGVLRKHGIDFDPHFGSDPRSRRALYKITLLDEEGDS